MKDVRPQHQPFAHLDGAGAEKVRHQPLQHQHDVDGGAAGEVGMDKKRFVKVRKSFPRDIRGYMVGQQHHQPQPKLPAVEVVDKTEGCLDIARNNQVFWYRSTAGLGTTMNNQFAVPCGVQASFNLVNNLNSWQTHENNQNLN